MRRAKGERGKSESITYMYCIKPTIKHHVTSTIKHLALARPTAARGATEPQRTSNTNSWMSPTWFSSPRPLVSTPYGHRKRPKTDRQSVGQKSGGVQLSPLSRGLQLPVMLRSPNAHQTPTPGSCGPGFVARVHWYCPTRPQGPA